MESVRVLHQVGASNKCAPSNFRYSNRKIRKPFHAGTPFVLSQRFHQKFNESRKLRTVADFRR